MGNIYRVSSTFVDSQASIVKDKRSSAQQIRRSIKNMAHEIGKRIVEIYFIKKEEIQTPINNVINVFLPQNLLTLVITTKIDYDFLGKGIAEVMDNCMSGYLNFGDMHGLQALNAPIREMELPEIKNESVEMIIIAKTVLATGCTAISLAKSACKEYFPRRLVIASTFYSSRGLRELSREFPNADIFIIGEADDDVDESGILVANIGHLDNRLNAQV